MQICVLFRDLGLANSCTPASCGILYAPLMHYDMLAENVMRLSFVGLHMLLWTFSSAMTLVGTRFTLLAH